MRVRELKAHFIAYERASDFVKFGTHDLCCGNAFALNFPEAQSCF